MKVLRYILISFILITIYSHTSAQTPATADSLVKLAVQLNKQAKYTDAVDKYTQALKIDPDNVYANYGIAYSLLQAGKGDDGIPYLETVVKTSTAVTPWAYDLLGSIYDKDNNTAKAIEAFNAGIKADPKYQRLYYNLSLVYFRTKNYPEAEKTVVQSIKIDPTHANSQRVYALVCFHQNKRTNALLGLCSFILLEPNTPRTKEAYGNIEHILGGGTLKVGPGTGTPDIDANTAALNQAISAAVAAAANGKYATPADMLTAQLTGIFNVLGPLADKQNGDVLLRTYYADYFYKLAQSPNMPAFAHLVSNSEPASVEWIKNNPQKMTDLDSWVKGMERVVPQ
jgi:tetratricopeptide (TPR) repeat protein